MIPARSTVSSASPAPARPGRRERPRARVAGAFAGSLGLHAGFALAAAAAGTTVAVVAATWAGADRPSAGATSIAFRADQPLAPPPAPAPPPGAEPPAPPALPLPELSPPLPRSAGEPLLVAEAPGDAFVEFAELDERTERDWLARAGGEPVKRRDLAEAEVGKAEHSPAAKEAAAPAVAATPNAGAAPADEGTTDPSPAAGRNLPPRYPFAAKARRIEGTVVVLLEIGADGAVTNARVVQSSGFGLLDDAALQQLGTWRFEPARRGGGAVASTWRQEVVFRLK